MTTLTPPDPYTYQPRTPKDVRFWRLVTIGPDCWEWSGIRIKQGYGRLSTGPRGHQRQELAHRISWELHNGPIPAGMLICHHCDNPPCVRPDHLYLGTHETNLRDALERGRIRRGSRHGMAKLTEEQVRAIRAATGVQRRIAEQFGISIIAVSAIKSGRTWGWLS